MKIEIDKELYDRFKKTMNKLHYIQRTNDLFIKSKLEKLVRKLVENEIEKHETHS